MQYDYIIVGRGLAATVLAEHLLRKGQRLLFVEGAAAFAATPVAAGILNPITGRNLLKTWLADEAFPLAFDYYARLERDWGKQGILLRQPLHWAIETARDWNDWQARRGDPITAHFVAELHTAAAKTANLRDCIATAELAYSGRIDFISLVEGLKSQTQAADTWQEMFDYSALQILDNQKVVYKDIKAKGIIFCEGAAAWQKNPYFGALPFQPTKGEVLIIHLPDYEYSDRLLKHKGILLSPWREKGTYWLGSTYERDAATPQPTTEARNFLLHSLRAALQTERIEVVEHLAALRPTVRDRRPYLGAHRQHRNLFIFNGLGAKGTYLAPYFAPAMADFILENKALPKLVDITRLKLG